eukprot:4658615-Lingulodinium_polyedra.AAC.1
MAAPTPKSFSAWLGHVIKNPERNVCRAILIQGRAGHVAEDITLGERRHIAAALDGFWNAQQI